MPQKWNGTNGYGGVNYNGKYVYAHRIAAMLYINFDIKSKLLICHKYDIKNCVNPDHLFIGTPSDNINDCINKGRKVSMRKTHFICGHEKSIENTYYYKGGGGLCIGCQRVNQHRTNQRRKEERHARKFI